MKNLTLQQYHDLREGAEVLAADGFGDKVLRLPDGHILKLFRLKRFFSSALLYPYSKRFSNNVAQLVRLQVPTVRGLTLYNIPDIKRTAVHYQPLPGESLDDAIKNGDFNDSRISQLAAFLASLHQQGVYFRSIHLGNIIITPDNQLGLIDVSDMKIYRHPLSAWLCARNLRHMCRYPEHINALFPAGNKQLFLKVYLDALQWPKKKRQHLEKLMTKQLIKRDVELA